MDKNFWVGFEKQAGLTYLLGKGVGRVAKKIKGVADEFHRGFKKSIDAPLAERAAVKGTAAHGEYIDDFAKARAARKSVVRDNTNRGESIGDFMKARNLKLRTGKPRIEE